MRIKKVFSFIFIFLFTFSVPRASSISFSKCRMIFRFFCCCASGVSKDADSAIVNNEIMSYENCRYNDSGSVFGDEKDRAFDGEKGVSKDADSAITNNEILLNVNSRNTASGSVFGDDKDRAFDGKSGVSKDADRDSGFGSASLSASSSAGDPKENLFFININNSRRYYNDSDSDSDSEFIDAGGGAKDKNKKNIFYKVAINQKKSKPVKPVSPSSELAMQNFIFSISDTNTKFKMMRIKNSELRRRRIEKNKKITFEKINEG